VCVCVYMCVCVCIQDSRRTTNTTRSRRRSKSRRRGLRHITSHHLGRSAKLAQRPKKNGAKEVGSAEQRVATLFFFSFVPQNCEPYPWVLQQRPKKKCKDSLFFSFDLEEHACSAGMPPRFSVYLTAKYWYVRGKSMCPCTARANC